MRIRTFGSVIALSSAATIVVTACGDDTTVRTTEPCTAGDSSCVSEKVGRACPEGPEPGWVYFACGDTEVCAMGACVLDESQAGRLGLCQEDQKECVSDALARQCAKGGNAWLPLACAAGTFCHNGDCVPVGSVDAGPTNPVLLCTPGAIECATEYAVKTCQNDGSEWVLSLCQSDELCQDGACVPNREGACVANTSQCLDSAHGLRCREDGSGYDEFTCPTEAPCDGFKCQGTVCTPGETKCQDPADAAGLNGPLSVQGHIFAGNDQYQCNAMGNGWDVIPCGLDELCVYNSLTPTEASAYEDLYVAYLQDLIAADKANTAYPTPPVFIHPPNRFMEASCVMPDCQYSMGSLGGQFVCGDPNQTSTDAATFYQRCEGLAPFTTPMWVPYTCQAPEVCNPDVYYNDEDPCSTDCVPGTTRCGNLFGNDTDSVYGCNLNGEWELQESCNEGVAKAETCFQQNAAEPGEPPTSAQCVDPLCAYIWGSYYDNAEDYGVCVGDEIINCDESGQLVDVSEAMPCSSGRCYQSEYNYDGSYLGWCEEECTDGAVRCLDPGTTSDIYYYGWGTAENDSPFFITCVNGVWARDAYEACPAATPGGVPEACFQIYEDLQQGEQITNVVCGGECQPGFRQCEFPEDGGTSGVQTCGPDGFWGEAVTCEVGNCREEGHGQSGYVWDAECAFDCVPGTYYGSAEYLGEAGAVPYLREHQCGDDGRWDPVGTRCDGPWQHNAEHFEESIMFVSLQAGCYECYGPELAYYWSQIRNDEFLVESKCDLDGNIIWCGDDNMWQDPVTCGAGNQCYTYQSRGVDAYGGEPGPDGSFDRAYCAAEPPPVPVVDAGSGDAGDGAAPPPQN